MNHYSLAPNSVLLRYQTEVYQIKMEGLEAVAKSLIYDIIIAKSLYYAKHDSLSCVHYFNFIFILYCIKYNIFIKFYNDV